MPVLYSYKEKSGFYAKACIQGAIVTFQLSDEGVAELAGAGLTNKDKFPQAILLDLIRRGMAFTGGVGTAEAIADEDQLTFDWKDEEDLFEHLPKCEETHSTIDLHLVVVDCDGKPRARILGPDPRVILRKQTLLSVPVGAIDLKLLERLQAIGKLPVESPAVVTVRNWLRQDRQKEWDKLRQAMSARQTRLNLDLDDGLLV